MKNQPKNPCLCPHKQPKLLLLLLFILNFLTLPLFVVAQTSQSNQTSLIQMEITQWQMRQVGNLKPIAIDWIKASVPGCVHTDLLDNKLIEDPFYRTNEKSLQWIDKTNWEYQSIFNVDRNTLSKQNISLLFKGLDTYADVYVNDKLLLSADNMFREWNVDVKAHLKEGQNTLRIFFHSPIQKGLVDLAKLGYPLPAVNDQSENGELKDSKVSVFTRKAGYHYGWDWGPRFVTSGIWRPVYLEAWDNAKIENVQYKQIALNKDLAKLQAKCEIQSNQAQKVNILITDIKNGNLLVKIATDLKAGLNQVNLDFSIKNPKLWWSRGLGEAHLYSFKTEIQLNQQSIDSKTERIGLRTVKIIQEKDAKGTSFYVSLNGVPVFCKGANYIPNDNFLNRVTDARYKQVVMNAVNANMNMLRVWGGGIYENDVFYDLCDENGIMVWQDFMFACSMYPNDQTLLENIKQEAIQNVKRLRNHASIVLWCGNNEIDAAWAEYDENKGWGWKQKYTPEQRKQIWEAYQHIFHEILPQAVKENDDKFYWSSSPLNEETLDKSRHSSYTNTSGDMHYWDVWHGKKPFSEFKKIIPRFMSEFGFQSFPEFKTVKSYTIPSDWNIESEVMAAHQRSGIGNLRIKEYMSWDYRLPKDFENFLYVGQVLQAEGMKMGFEAHRRNMPFCMGSLYWQINDCWQVASWSSTDYFGRWKALHYFVKKAFREVLVSSVEDDGILNISIISDRLKPIQADLQLRILDFRGKVLWDKTIPAQIASNSSKVFFSQKTSELLKGIDAKNTVLSIKVLEKGKEISDNVWYFVPTKDLSLSKPAIQTKITQTDKGYAVELTSNALAKNVYLQLEEYEGFFSDNYVDILPNEKTTIYFKSNTNIKDFEKKLKIISLVDSY